MHVRETHKNGSTIELRGLFGVAKALDQWRARQDEAPEVEEEEARPKVVGASTAILSGSPRRSEISDDRVPIINAQAPFKFGFQPNQETLEADPQDETR